ncbi:XRE family transcriptional regulator [Arachidicoccus ginsenosidimutans]|uniref:XRE family transcriptional regulator n=1 Tax=Arachidicoccus sp. BS20 TaxID=1850526 RepID=UPI0007F0BF4E|nr:XRE family transcriptional regulator [Arachidicoccus sp. BS20]ANI88908.1 XRE family transcriptional regulator [Arachidicoccus sp. BS20]
MSYAGKNLRYLRKLRGWTQEQFANKINIKRSLLGAYEEERAEPRIEILETVCRLFKLSMDDMLLKDLEVPKGGGSYIDKRRAMKMTASASADILFVPVKAAAGYLAGYADTEFLDELNTFTLPMLAPGYYRAFEIVGDSMLPTPSGSVIVGEKVENFDDVKNNNAYIVVSRSNGIVYKRINKNNRAKNKVTLVSDNPIYEPYQIDEEDVLELWKAQMIITKASVQNRWDVGQLAGMVNNLQEQVATLSKKMN